MKTQFARAAILFASLSAPLLKSHGQGLGHTLPPVVNLVGAGYNLEYSAKVKKAGIYTMIIGGGITGILANANGTRGTAAPWISSALTLGFGVGLNLHGLRWEDRAGDLLKCGYSPWKLYESIPDSVGSDPARRYDIPSMIDGNEIHIPGRWR